MSLTELIDLWEEVHLTVVNHSNLSNVEMLLCSSAVSHASFLHILSVFYVVIFLLGLAANVLVVWVNLQSDRKCYETHLYMVNLAAADLCVVATLPVWVASLLQGGRWPFGVTVCKFTHLIFSVNLLSSIFFLMCMSVDCYLSITLPAASDGRKKVARQLICVLVWLLALVASVPETHFLQVVKSLHHDGAVCRPVYPTDNPQAWMAGVQLSFIVLGFVIPFPIITTFYLLLAAAVSSSSDRERRHNCWTISTYIVVFLVCWLPFHTILLMDTLSVLNILPFSCQFENFLDIALHVTQCFSLLHCCLNPVLYNFLNSSYRYDVKKAFILRYSRNTGLATLINSSGTIAEWTCESMEDSLTL